MRNSETEVRCGWPQVGLKSSFGGPHGQLVFFLGNKSAVPLQRVVCGLPPVLQLAFQLSQVPHVIEPKKQARSQSTPPPRTHRSTAGVL